jgi:RNA polymerase sigma-70 factor (ECF subfamily)
MEDRELVCRFLQRDETALEAAEERYGGSCRALARNLLGSSEDAEECWSDALFRAWNAIPPEEPRSLKAYLLKLTRRQAIARLRARTAEKRGGGASELLLEELEECLPGIGDAESETLARTLGEKVNAFLRELPRRERTIFIRRCFFGETPGELAARFGMRENTVNVSLRRTRLKLRAMLEKEGYTE